MKKFIITEEEKNRILNLHEGFKKGVITEQFTKVEGPYKNVAGIAIIGDLYIMRLEKSMCRHQSQNFTMTSMTGTTCGEDYITIPGGKFYIGTSEDGKIRMLTSNHKQYVSARNELIANRNSRRATMIYTRPTMHKDYCEDGCSDFMCTNAVQYLIRGNKLHAIVQMRSNDVIFGYKNDRAWQFEVQNRLLKDINALSDEKYQLGDLIWHVGSLHVYERHFPLING